MDKQRVSVYREMLAELKEERKQIDWQITWLQGKITSARQEPNTIMVFGDEFKPAEGVEVVPADRELDASFYKRNPAEPIKAGMTDIVEAILLEANRPLHAKNILEGLKTRGNTTTTIKSLTGSMPQDSRKRFENLGKNVWALRKWPDDMKDSYKSANTALVFS